ncbi:hypothetical protein D3C83_299100 [compost metagenome]
MPPEIDRLEATMEIRAYRQKPSTPAAGSKAGGTQPKGSAAALWDYLQQSAASGS